MQTFSQMTILNYGHRDLANLRVLTGVAAVQVRVQYLVESTAMTNMRSWLHDPEYLQHVPSYSPQRATNFQYLHHFHRDRFLIEEIEPNHGIFSHHYQPLYRQCLINLLRSHCSRWATMSASTPTHLSCRRCICKSASNRNIHRIAGNRSSPILR